MHAVAPLADDQLREHHGHPPVPGGVADVVLARVVVRRVDHEPAAGVGRGGAQVLDVRAVPGLGHREAARQLQGHDVAQVPLVVARGAEHLDRAAEQSPLDAGLDHQRQVAVAEQLEGHDRAADVALAAVLPAEAEPRVTARHQLPQLLGDLGPVGLAVEVVGVGELRAGQVLAQPPAQLAARAVEDRGERGGIDVSDHDTGLPGAGPGHTRQRMSICDSTTNRRPVAVRRGPAMSPAIHNVISVHSVPESTQEYGWWPESAMGRLPPFCFLL